MISGISLFDLIVCALVLMLGLRGVMSGFVKEAFGLLGIVGGVIAAVRYAHLAGSYISANFYKIDSTSAQFFIGFIAVLFGVWLTCIVVGALLSRLIGFSGLGFVDRLGGFIIGSAKIFLVFSIIVVVISQIGILNEKLKPYFEKSFTHPYLMSAGKWIMSMDTDDISSNLNRMKTGIDAKFVEQNETKTVINTDLNVTNLKDINASRH